MSKGKKMRDYCETPDGWIITHKKDGTTTIKNPLGETIEECNYSPGEAVEADELWRLMIWLASPNKTITNQMFGAKPELIGDKEAEEIMNWIQSKPKQKPEPEPEPETDDTPDAIIVVEGEKKMAEKIGTLLVGIGIGAWSLIAVTVLADDILEWIKEEKHKARRKKSDGGKIT